MNINGCQWKSINADNSGMDSGVESAWFLAPSPSILDPGSWILAPVSWLLDPGPSPACCAVSPLPTWAAAAAPGAVASMFLRCCFDVDSLLLPFCFAFSSKKRGSSFDYGRLKKGTKGKQCLKTMKIWKFINILFGARMGSLSSKDPILAYGAERDDLSLFKFVPVLCYFRVLEYRKNMEF